ncbi:type II toxin-antitoxin system Phd/YefM family antitoxin [Pseudomonas canadensis]|uniref:type II toxin-antitoxin system Phd/YefM family antitoxin n=1 Tax=Pseudomonas TaxID=286 RepID=UPI003D6AF6F8
MERAMKPTCVEITVTLDQAEADFSNLVHQASAGQPITITQYGRALARLIAIEP